MKQEDANYVMAVRASLILILVGVMASGCGAPAPSAVLEGSQSPQVHEPDPLQPSTIIWLAGRSLEVNDLTVALQLTLGRGDGHVLWRDQLELDGSLPGGGIGFASGPASGVLAFGLAETNGATVHVVSATDPVDRVVATVAEVLVSGSVDPTGTWIYVATQPGPDQLRISRVPVNGGEVERLADLGPEFLPNGATFSEDLLRWTPDGTRLLIQGCDMTGRCWWKVMDQATNQLGELRPAGAGTGVGVTNDTLLALATGCAVGPCPFVLIDLATGASRPFDPHAHEARTALTRDGHTVILSDNQGVDGGATIRIKAYDPATGEESLVYESDAGLGLPREGQGAWAPAGWFVVAGQGQNVGEGGIGPTLVRIADGFELRLAPLPDT